MKSKKLALVVIVAAVLFAVAGIQAADYVPGELIVKLEHGILEMSGVDELAISQVTIHDQELVQALEGYGTSSVEKVFKSADAQAGLTYNDVSQVYLFRLDEGFDIELVADELGQLAGVIYAEPNYIAHFCLVLPNDSDFDLQWGLHNSDYGWDINALKVWKAQTGDPDVLLAILDTGLELNHYNESTDEFFMDTRVAGWWPSRGSAEDEHSIGHGTFTTGVAAATTGNGSGQGGVHGIAGVAGGWDGQGGVKLLIAKTSVLWHFVQAIDWAREQGAKVLNGSWHIDDQSGALRDAIENAFADDMTLFFSSANSSDPEDNIAHPAVLAEYDICCAVGNIQNDGSRYYSSCYGPELSFVAPGTGIWSTTNSDPWYMYGTGTSAAAPFATGIGALVHSTGEYLVDVDLKRILEHTARDILPEGWDDETGYGCVDAWEALIHMYWPYELEHHTIPTAGLAFEHVGYEQVEFTDDPNDSCPAGTYWCNKYRLSATDQYYNPRYEQSPWVWGRLLDVPTGYSSNNPNNAWFWVGVDDVTLSDAYFETYVYELVEDEHGNPIPPESKWAPSDPLTIQIAYTVLGRMTTWQIFTYLQIPSVNYGQYSDLVVHPTGLDDVHVSYYDAETQDLYYILHDYWGLDKYEQVDYTGDVGKWSSIALDSSYYPHIFYHDATFNIAKHAWKDASGWHTEPILWEGVTGNYGGIHCDVAYPGPVDGCFFITDGNNLASACGCGPDSWWVEVVDEVGDVGRWCAFTVDSIDHRHISYYDASNGNLKYATRAEITVADIWHIEVVDATGDVGLYTDIALDQDGYPHISYYDATNGNLKHAWKDVSGWDNEIVESSGDVGKWTSICIDDDDQPVIVYQNASDADVKRAQRLANGSWDIEEVETRGIAGNYGTSVGIDNLGRMVCNYYRDGALGELRVARRAQWRPNSSGIMSTGVGEEVKVVSPLTASLTAVTPNPVSGSATIYYYLPTNTNIRIKAYDISGKLVDVLCDGDAAAGHHSFDWDAGKLPAGLYFLRMETPGFSATRKLVLIR